MERISARHRLAKRTVLLAVVACSFALSGTSASAAATVTAKDTMEPAVVERINDIRAAHGLRRLTAAGDLSSAAVRHANSMSARGYFKHELYTPSRSVNWTPYGTWIRWYWPGPGYTSWATGENLAWGAPDLSARQAVSRWMNSAPHRANILTASWRRIGVAAVHVSDPLGYFGSWSDVTIVVAEFGRRS
jgi:uncharacterized protein YkwD